MARTKTVGGITAYDPNFSVDKNGVVTEKYINNEDLTMFVDLAVKIPSRDYNPNNITGIDTLMGGTKTGNGSESYLTTDYITMSFTDIQNGAVNNREMFGVESIDISFDPYFFPVVTMSFIDVRGLSLMQPIDKKYVKESEALLKGKSVDAAAVFFEALFNFPYPTFTLTVKGYYGPIVSFDLRPEDFKSSFDATTGNFRCNIRFIGSMYGDLTEIPASYVLCAPYFDSKDGTLEGTVWKQKNFKFDEGDIMPTALQIIEIYKNVVSGQNGTDILNSELVQNIIKNEEVYNVLNVIHSCIKNYEDSFQEQNDSFVIGTIVKPGGEKNEYNIRLFLGDNNVVTKINKYDEFVKKKIEVRTTYKEIIENNETLKTIFKTIDDKINPFANTSEKKNTNYEYGNSSNAKEIKCINYAYDSFNKGRTGSDYEANKNNFLSEVNSFIQQEVTDEDIKNISKSIYEKGSSSKTAVDIQFSSVTSITNKKVIPVCALPSFNFILNTIEKEINNAQENGENIQKDKEKTSDVIYNVIKFRPTIKNLYKIYFAHLEVLFLHIEKCVSSANNNGFRFKGVSEYNFDSKSSSVKIKPFPQITQNVGSNGAYKIEYPFNDSKFNESDEAKLVNKIFDGVTGLAKKIEEYIDAIEAIQQVAEGTPIGEVAPDNFEATFSYDYVIDWGGPYRKALEGFSNKSDDECADELICLFMLRLLRYYSTIQDDGKFVALTFDEFVTREANNMMNATFNGIDNAKKIEILKKIKAKSDSFKSIFNKRVNDVLGSIDDNGDIQKFLKDNYNKGKNLRFAFMPNVNTVLSDIKSKKYDRRIVIGNLVKSADTMGVFPLGKSIDEKFYKDYVTNIEIPYKDLYIFDCKLRRRRIIGGKLIDNINKLTDIKDKNDKKKITLFFNFVENDIKLRNNRKYYADNRSGFLYFKDRSRAELKLSVTNYVFKCRLMELIKIGAYLWVEGNFNKKYGNYSILQPHYFISKGSSTLIHLPKLVDGNTYFVSPNFTSTCLKLFEEWAEGEGDMVTIGNGIKVYGFDHYFKIGDKSTNYEVSIRKDLQNVTGEKEVTINNSTYRALSLKQFNQGQDDSEKSIFGKIVNICGAIFYEDYEEKYNENKHDKGLKDKIQEIKEVQESSVVAQEIGKIKTSRQHKTHIYYALKNIYDKIIINKTNTSETWVNNEFNKMKFVNNFMKNNEGMMVPFDGIVRIIDKYLSVDKSPSFIELLAETAQINKCQFLTMPFMTLTNEHRDLLFEPIKWWSDTQGKTTSNTFVVLQPGEVSRNLDTNCNDENDYKNDGFDIANDFVSGGINPLGNDATAFAVTYGIQNQNYFKNVTLNMDSPTPTDESIANLLDISKMVGDGAVMRPIPMKSSLYPVYANRTYNCTVDMMGNMGITPLMYFQLNNVPMFRGAYMITNVSHKITPRDFTTTFTGTRVSKYEIPLPGSEIFFNSLLELARKAKKYTTVVTTESQEVGGTGGSKNYEELLLSLDKNKKLVNIQDLDPTIKVDLKYNSTDNFVGVNMYNGFNKAYMHKNIAECLVNAQKKLKAEYPNCTLLIYDAARPNEAQCTMKKWITGEYTPNPDKKPTPEQKKNHTKYVAACGKGNAGLHVYCMAVDLTIAENGIPLDMGAKFDEFDEDLAGLGGNANISLTKLETAKATMAAQWKKNYKAKGKTITDTQINNRFLLHRLMRQSGLSAYNSEWWHFQLPGTKDGLRDEGVFFG